MLIYIYSTYIYMLTTYNLNEENCLALDRGQSEKLQHTTTKNYNTLQHNTTTHYNRKQ